MIFFFLFFEVNETTMIVLRKKLIIPHYNLIKNMSVYCRNDLLVSRSKAPIERKLFWFLKTPPVKRDKSATNYIYQITMKKWGTEK